MQRNHSYVPTFASVVLLAFTPGDAGAQGGESTPPAAPPPFAELRDSTFFPEGLDVHPRTGALYVTSIRHGTIVERAADGRERELLPRHDPTRPALLGVRVDIDGATLWTTVASLPYSAIARGARDTTVAALLRIRIRDGAVVGRWPVPATAAAPMSPILGDLAVARDGTVWITDSRNPQLLRLRRGAASIERFGDSLFRNLQGVALAGDDGTLYLADYSRGILRVDVASMRVSRVAGPTGLETRGLDGIALHDDGIVAVQNGVRPARVVRFALSPDGRSITGATVLERDAHGSDEPTIGAMTRVDGRTWFVYVANSQWDKYDGEGRRTPGTRLARPLLRRVAMPGRR